MKIKLLIVMLLVNFGALNAAEGVHRRRSVGEQDGVELPATTTTSTKKCVIFDGHGTLWEQWHKHFVEAFVITWFNAPVQDKAKLLATLANPTLWKNVKSANQQVFDLFVHAVCNGIPVLEQYRLKFIENYNRHELNLEMVKIVKELRAQGYTIILGSNIGLASLTELIKRRPLIDKLMDGYCIVRSPDGSEEKLREVIGTKPLAVSEQVKPLSEYWDCLKQLAPTGPFIDDRADIVSAATANGFKGIQITTPAQLRTELQGLNYLQEKKTQ